MVVGRRVLEIFVLGIIFLAVVSPLAAGADLDMSVMRGSFPGDGVSPFHPERDVPLMKPGPKFDSPDDVLDDMIDDLIDDLIDDSPDDVLDDMIDDLIEDPTTDPTT
ncbi:hypothetical protein, partial [Methanofollis sp. UBA420]|uniref:hypothetical protein n=1 Tax=Methanofollis sp. UBA420 TaxID=1915514 RepID=UPI00316ACDE2